MPTVPRIDRQIEPQGIPNARLNPSAVPSVSMDKTLGTAENIAKDYYEAEKRKFDQTSLLDADLHLSEFVTILRTNSAQYKGKDAPQALDYIKDLWDEHVPRIEANLGNDEQKLAFKNRVVSHWSSLYNNVSQYVASEGDRYTEDTTKAWVINKINMAKKDYNNPKAMEYSLLEINAVLKDFYRSRGRGDDEIAVEFENVKNKLHESAKMGFVDNLSAMITANDPQLVSVYKALKETQKGQYVNYPILDTKDREMAIKDIEGWVKESDKVFKEKLKTDQTQTGNSFFTKLNSGTLTLAEIDKSILDPTGENSKTFWAGKLEERRTKKDEIKTDSATQLYIREHILEYPDDVEANKGMIYENINKLSESDANSLMEKALSEKKSNESFIMKRSYEFIKSQIAPSRGLLAAGSPGEDDNLKRAYDNFDAFIAEAKEKNPHLDAGTIDTIARQTASSFMPDMKQRMEWLKESFILEKNTSQLTVPGKESLDMPDPVINKGKILKETITGQRYESDGKTWKLIK